MPPLLNDCLSISINLLKRRGLLVPGKRQVGFLQWERGGQVINSIGIEIYVSAEDQEGFMHLEYIAGGMAKHPTFDLIAVPSNLGVGLVWYFICPETGKQCRKLHLIGSNFMHRTAAKGCYYEKQIKSRKQRELQQGFDALFGTDVIFEQMNSKHFKRYYRGKNTRRYSGLLDKLSKCERNAHKASLNSILNKGARNRLLRQ